MALNESIVKIHLNTILLVFTFMKYTEAIDILIWISSNKFSLTDIKELKKVFLISDFTVYSKICVKCKTGNIAADLKSSRTGFFCVVKAV